MLMGYLVTAHKAILGRRGRKVRKARKDRRVILVHRGPKVPRALPGILALKDPKAPPGHKVLLAHKDHKGI